MNDCLVENWNHIVHPHDNVHCLGDLFLNSDLDKIDSILGRLKGNIFIVRGNHDKWLAKSDRLKHRNKIRSVKDYDERSYMHQGEKVKVVLMHFPLHAWNKGHYGSIHLHGHCHGALDAANEGLRRFDVGVDSLNATYAPIALEDILRWSKDIDFAKNHHIGD